MKYYATEINIHQHVLRAAMSQAQYEGLAATQIQRKEDQS